MRLRFPRPARRTILVALGLVLGLVAAFVVYVLSISTPIRSIGNLASVPAAGSPAFLDLVGLHTDVRFAPGHDIRIALDGDGTFPPLWRDLEAARESIHVQLYYCQPGTLADSLAAILGRRTRAGVTVRFLYDGFGCDPLGDEWFDRLREDAVDIRAFRPVRWWSLFKAQERSHARIVVVDGRVGWTGGFGIDDRWSEAGADGEPGWRETNARFTGPAVAQLQAAFADGWAESTGSLLVDPALYGGLAAMPDSAGARPAGATAALLHSVPDAGSTTAERLLALTLGGARRTLYVANAYFVPDDDFRAMLIAAAARGVDVRILAPDERTDVPLVRHAARAHYAELLEGGVRIWEYGAAMMHAKTFVVDGVWSAIGSLNFDNRSIAVNDETTLLVSDSVTGAAMDRLFLDDLRRATELTLPAFQRRGWRDRFRERFAVLASRFL